MIVVPAMWDVGSRAPARGRVAQGARGRERDRGVRVQRRRGPRRRGVARWPEGHGQLGEHRRVGGRYPIPSGCGGLRYVEDSNVTTAAGVTSGVSATLHVDTRVRRRRSRAGAGPRDRLPDQSLGDEPRISADRLTASDRALYVLWRALRVGQAEDRGGPPRGDLGD